LAPWAFRAIVPRPMRALDLAAITLLFPVLLAACAGYTSEARQSEITREIRTTNQESLSRALGATLRARGATLLAAKDEPLVVRACGRMPPLLPAFMPIEHVYVLEGYRVDAVEYVDVPYDGLGEEVVCDEYLD
jgi:hypothetical protein